MSEVYLNDIPAEKVFEFSPSLIRQNPPPLNQIKYPLTLKEAAITGLHFSDLAPFPNHKLEKLSPAQRN